MIELPRLRIAERFGVRGRSHGCQSGSFGGTRVCQNGHVCPRRAYGRAGEVFSDVCFDRSSRGQEKVHRHHTDRWESGVRQSRYGLRSVRVGEASHPGPHGRRTRDSAEKVLDGLERVESDCI